VLADFDHDGMPEIVQTAFDGNVYVWHGDGSALDSEVAGRSSGRVELFSWSWGALRAEGCVGAG
jgi:hypothetical protein